MRDPELLALSAEPLERRRRNPSRDREVMGRRPQVLADRDDVDLDRAQVGERVDDLVVGLSHADDDPRLRDETGSLRAGEQGETAGVAS